jgi:hypothetical protein
MSLGAHVGLALIAVLFVFLHGRRAAPPDERPERSAPDVVEATTIEPEPGSVEVDALAGGRAPAESPEPAAEVKPAPAPVPEPAPRTDPARVQEALPSFAEKTVLNEGVPGGVEQPTEAPPRPRARPETSARAVASSAPATAGSPEGSPASAGSSAAGDAGDGPGTGDGGHARTAPSVASRFTKELAAYAAHVPGWQDAPLGATASVELTLELDAEGRVVRTRDPLEGVRAPDALLSESARRTVKSLLLVFSLPDRPVGAGIVVLRASATVSDREPPSDADPNGIAYAFRFEGKTGAAWFTLATGRHVEIAVEVLRVEAK